MKIHFGQLIHALSDTIDLVGVDELHHGKRVGFMAMEIAKLMGADRPKQLRLYRAGLLHDCGVSSTWVHRQLVNELDWTESQHHCRIGAERLSHFSPLADYSDIILYHHTRWDELRDEPLTEETKTEANLIYLADRVDALVNMQHSPTRLGSRHNVCRRVDNLRHTYFKPELVDALLAAAECEAFWITQEPDHLRDYLHLQTRDQDELFLNTNQLRNLARIFAEIVDAKSPFTAEHSFGVTRLAGYLAERCQLSDTTIASMEVAGLLHDLGKLQVPDKILDLKGGLNIEDLTIMRRHSYVTHMILSRIQGLENITLWASDHHEKLDGSGYPFRKTASELGLESRIIMIADIYQALAQNRPYRSPLKPDEIVEIIRKEVNQNKLDREIFHIVEKERPECHNAATVA